MFEILLFLQAFTTLEKFVHEIQLILQFIYTGDWRIHSENSWYLCFTTLLWIRKSLELLREKLRKEWTTKTLAEENQDMKNTWDLPYLW